MCKLKNSSPIITLKKSNFHKIKRGYEEDQEHIMSPNFVYISYKTEIVITLRWVTESSIVCWSLCNNKD